MENLKLKRLNFKNVMFSMAVIMLVWAVVSVLLFRISEKFKYNDEQFN